MDMDERAKRSGNTESDRSNNLPEAAATDETRTGDGGNGWATTDDGAGRSGDRRQGVGGAG